MIYTNTQGAKAIKNRTAVYAFAAATAFFFNTYLILVYGSEIPFWDEWDAQAANLLIPLLRGQLHFADVLANHNEHRIFFGRVIWLLSYSLSGYWDVKLIMVLNSLIHGAFVLMLINTLSGEMDQRRFCLVATLVVLISCLPMGWENILWGMQSVVYALLLFALLANFVLSKSKPLTLRWLFGTFIAICSYFCMASGALTLVPYIIFSIYMLLRTKDWKYVGSILIHSAITGVLLMSIPKLNYSVLKPAQDVYTAYNSFVLLVSWPLPPHFISAVLLNMPFVIFTIRAVRARSVSPSDWAGILWTLWVYLHIAAFAYGRGETTGMTSRYADIVIQSTIANAAFLVALNYRRRSRSIISLATVASAVWAGVVAVFLLMQVQPSVSGLEWRRGASALQDANLHRYLTTGDPTVLAGLPHAAIPYPSDQRLIGLINDATLQKILPPRINPKNTEATVILAPMSGFHLIIDYLKNFILKASPYIALLSGLGVLVLTGLSMRNTGRLS